MILRRLILALLSILLVISVSAVALADTELTQAEVDELRSLLGTSSTDNVLTLPSGGITAYTALDWLEDFSVHSVGISAEYEDVCQMTSQAISQASAANKPALSQQLTQVHAALKAADSELDRHVIQPLEYFRTRMYYNANRLETLLLRLKDDAAKLTAGNRQEIARECRMLKEELLADIGELRNLESTAHTKMTAARDTLNNAHGAGLSSMLDTMQSTLTAAALNLQGQEEGRFSASSPGTDIEVISANQFAVAVVASNDPNKAKLPLYGAEVTVSCADDANVKKTFTIADADGKRAAVFLIADFKPNKDKKVAVHVLVKAAGRRQMELERVVMEGGKSLTLCPPADDQTPYLSMASFNTKDMFTITNTIYASETNLNTQQLNIKIVGATAGKIDFLVNGTLNTGCSKSFTATDLKDGVLKWPGTWNHLLKTKQTTVDAKLSFRLTLPDQKTYEFPCAMGLRAALIDEPLFSSVPLSPFSPGALSFTLPKISIPGADNASISLGIPELPFSINVDIDGSVILYIGKQWKPYDWKSTDLIDREAFAKDFAKDSKIKTTAMAKGTMMNEYVNSKKPFLGNIKVNVNGFAGGIGNWSRHNGAIDVAMGELMVGVTVTLSIDLSKQFFIPTPVAPIPAFIGFDFNLNVTATAGGKLAFSLGAATWNDFAIQFSQNFTVGLKMELGLTVGLGFADIASLSVRGYAFFSVTLWINLGDQTTILYQLGYGGGAEATVKILFIKVNVPLFTFKDTYPKEPGQLYPKKTEQNSQFYLPTQASVGNAYQFSQYSNQLTALPSGSNAAPLTLGGRSILKAGGSEGIRPIQEVLHNGTFDVTSLKTVSVKQANSSSTYKLILFMGVYAGDAQDVFYAISSNDSPQLTVVGTIGKSGYGSGMTSDFDVAWDAVQNRLYLITSNKLHLNSDESSLYISCYTFNEATKKLVWQSEYSGEFKPLYVGAEWDYTTGNMRPTVITKPRIRANNGFVYAACYGKDIKTSSIVTAIETNVYGGTWNTANRNDLLLTKLCNVTDVPVDLRIPEAVYAIQNTFPFVLLTARKPAGTPGEDNPYTDYSISLYSSVLEKKQHVNPSGEEIIATTTKLDSISNRRVISMMDSFMDKSKIGCVFVEEVEDADGNPVRKVNGYTYGSGGSRLVDYGINAAVDWFGAAELNGEKYLYWIQSTQTTDQSEDVDDSYLIKCCLYDPMKDCFTAPFALLEVSRPPAALTLSDWQPSSGHNAFSLYACVDESSSSTNPLWNFASFEYKLNAAMDLNAIVCEYPCVSAGTDVNFYITVKNTGNIPIGSFVVEVEDSAKTYKASITVDVSKQSNNSVTLKNSQNQSVFEGGQYSVFRVPCVYDQYNGERMTQVIQTFAPQNLLSAATTFREVSIRALMPEAVQTYKIVMHIPEGWEGTKKLTATVKDIKIPSKTSMLTVAQPESANPNDVFTQAEIDAAIAPALSSNDFSFITLDNVSTKASAEMDVSNNDLALDQDVLWLDGVPYLQVFMTNYAQSNMAENAPGPRLTIEKDGATTYSHQFVNALDGSFGYNVLIPLDHVDGNGQYEELVTRITGLGADVNEFDDYDNSETFRGNALTPATADLPQTGDATPLWLYALAAALALTALAATLARPKRRIR